MPSTLFSETWAELAGTVVVGLLWQGTHFGVLVAVALAATRKRSPNEARSAIEYSPARRAREHKTSTSQGARTSSRQLRFRSAVPPRSASEAVPEGSHAVIGSAVNKELKDA
ncbi:MAG: hypothetical protein IT364_23670 [Candidatus Hydrogenedentes bacterium]|nr:hypothetical protein [Candidatus Hydrogenedentota bacterium]